MANIVAIVGRPNVGKSTLFNRLTGMRQAIVDEQSGVTRDRHYGKSDWNGVQFSIIDTGGYIIGSDDIFEEEIRKQVVLAIEESDVILFMLDAREGLTPMDKDVSNMLRKSGKDILIIANKIDNPSQIAENSEFFSLGLGNIYNVSSINGSGTGEMLDDMVKFLAKDNNEEETELPRFAVVGRPNVGKSSLINTLLGIDRNIVTNIPGTTRDSIFTRYNKYGFEFMLVDTAGVRKKAKVSEDVEFYSVMRSIRAIEYADVCIVMLDATLGFESQDMNIFSLAQRNSKGIVVCVNKWDLVEKDNKTHLEFEKAIHEKTAPFVDFPIIYTSVKEKQRIFKVLETAVEIFKNRRRKIKTSELNDKLLPYTTRIPPPANKGKYIKIKYITQLPTHAPSFAFFCNLPQYIKDPYRRFLENKLREHFDFTGIPIKIFFRKK